MLQAQEPHPNVILVEGSDDMHAVRHLLNHYYQPWSIQPHVKPKHSKPKLLKGLRNELLTDGLEKMGIIVDADNSAEDSWKSIGERLQQVGDIDFPIRLVAEGAILDLKPYNDNIVLKIGVWIMPDNLSRGSLESFAEKLMLPNPLWERARQCVDSIPDKHRLFGLRENDWASQKAYIHTWLAWQHNPEFSIGSAIEAGYLEPTAPLAHSFITWVSLLFDLPLP